ncbi:MAG: hypothetical protein JO131_10320, partial [Gammaproteobacteria bacterium]|nr:hypothetical protein [Gammaproteobacteria bacterium]
KEIERTLSNDTSSDPLRELYTDIKRSNRFHFYFNNRAVPNHCFPKIEDEKENEKAFKQFSDFLSLTLGEPAKQTLSKQYEQGKIAGITGGILNAGFAKNAFLSSSKNKECFIHFTAKPSSPSILISNQIKDSTYIKNDDIDGDSPEQTTLHGTLEVKLTLRPDLIKITSIASNALPILSLVLTNNFQKNTTFLNTCTQMVINCNTKIASHEGKPVALAYHYIRDKIIKLALTFLKNPNIAEKINIYKQILTDLKDPLYRSAFNKFHKELMQTKLQLTTFKASVDQYLTTDSQSKYEAYQQIAKKAEADLTLLQYSFPPNFKEHISTLKQIQIKIACTNEALVSEASVSSRFSK